jgi:DUF4097 and DUF4098 domain-containing protein YvlB
MGEETKGYVRTISTADFTETPRVSLEQPTGDVYVEGWDRPEIEVSCSDPEAMFDVSQSGAEIIINNRPGSFKLVNFVEPVVNEAKGFGIDLGKADIERAAARVERKVERSMRRFGRGFSVNVDIGRWLSGRDYYIKVPHSCNLTLRTSSGDLSVRDVTGTLLLQSTSGDIGLEQLGGNLLVSSASGDIEMNGVEGKLGTRSASGDIKIKRADLQEVSVTSASGDVTLEMTKMPDREWEIKSVSGDVNLYLPSDAQVTAQVRTLSGDINCGFPRSQVTYNPGRGRGEATLVINGGGLAAQFNTVSGDLNVKPRHVSDNHGREGRREDEGGQYTTDLSRRQAGGDITEAEGYAARRQAELEILQAVERGEISSQEAIERLGSLGR